MNDPNIAAILKVKIRCPRSLEIKVSGSFGGTGKFGHIAMVNSNLAGFT